MPEQEEVKAGINYMQLVSVDCMNCAKISGTTKPYSRKIYGNIVEQCPQCGDPWYEYSKPIFKTSHESWYAELADKTYFEVMNQREDILRAFIAQYGCKPDEIEQVEERIDGMIVYSVRRLSRSETGEQYPDTEADGMVFCGKCGKRKE